MFRFRDLSPTRKEIRPSALDFLHVVDQQRPGYQHASLTDPIMVLTGVREIAAGECHRLFLKTDGLIWAVGDNAAGQLGDRTTLHRNSPVKVMGGMVELVARAGGTASS